jgi:hypothetical protein
VPPVSFLKVLYAPLMIVIVYIAIRTLVDGALGVVLAITAVIVGIALMARTVRRNRRG